MDIATVITLLENYSSEPLPAALVVVGGLVVLNFALGVSSFFSDLQIMNNLCSYLNVNNTKFQIYTALGNIL